MITDPPRGILLVDDDLFMLNMQSQVLRAMGYDNVLTANRAEQALSLVMRGTEPVDIVICDLNMPGMDGIAFLQQLNSSPFRGSIVLLSGEGARVMHTVQKLLGHGRLVILGALEKPASREALRALIELSRVPTPPPRAAGADAPFTVTEADLDEATRAGQWVLHFQPKVDVTTAAPLGVEALVRWQHPAHGLVYPDRFIGIAEETGAIDGLTTWVIDAAMAQLVQWQAGGWRPKVAVNLSIASFRSTHFARQMGEMARDHGVMPQDMMFEVTESRLMAPTPVPLENLVRLRLQRFGLSIDDFGTGHSSLAQLRDVPFTELKIDRGFVKGARHDQIIRPMLEGSIGIAKRMGMQSVAEGVESEEDWRLLQEIGCDQAQGYFIARPMPADRMDAWRAEWAERQATLAKP